METPHGHLATDGAAPADDIYTQTLAELEALAEETRSDPEPSNEIGPLIDASRILGRRAEKIEGLESRNGLGWFTPSQAAAFATATGFSIFPVDEAKEPANGIRWTEMSLFDGDQIRATWPTAGSGVGIDCGRSGIVVLDHDRPAPRWWPGGFAAWERTFCRFSAIRQGLHEFYRQPADAPLHIGSGATQFGDMKGIGGYVVVSAWEDNMKDLIGNLAGRQMVDLIPVIPEGIRKALVRASLRSPSADGSVDLAPRSYARAGRAGVSVRDRLYDLTEEIDRVWVGRQSESFIEVHLKRYSDKSDRDEGRHPAMRDEVYSMFVEGVRGELDLLDGYEALRDVFGADAGSDPTRNQDWETEYDNAWHGCMDMREARDRKLIADIEFEDPLEVAARELSERLSRDRDKVVSGEKDLSEPRNSEPVVEQVQTPSISDAPSPMADLATAASTVVDEVSSSDTREQGLDEDEPLRALKESLERSEDAAEKEADAVFGEADPVLETLRDRAVSRIIGLREDSREASLEGSKRLSDQLLAGYRTGQVVMEALTDAATWDRDVDPHYTAILECRSNTDLIDLLESFERETERMKARSYVQTLREASLLRDAPSATFAEIEDEWVDEPDYTGLIRSDKQGVLQIPTLGSGADATGVCHSLVGPAHAGKTIIGMAAMVEQAGFGVHSVWVDFEMGKVRRQNWMKRLGAGKLAQLIHPIDMDDNSSVTLVSAYNLARDLQLELISKDPGGVDGTGERVGLFMVDSVSRAVARSSDGEEPENSSGAFIKLIDTVVSKLNRLGISTILVDHTGNGDQDRARGSSAKLQQVDAMYTFKVNQPWSANGSGSVSLIAQKDRGGLFSKGETAVVAEMVPDLAVTNPNRRPLRVKLWAPDSPSAGALVARRADSASDSGSSEAGSSSTSAAGEPPSSKKLHPGMIRLVTKAMKHLSDTLPPGELDWHSAGDVWKACRTLINTHGSGFDHYDVPAKDLQRQVLGLTVELELAGIDSVASGTLYQIRRTSADYLESCVVPFLDEQLALPEASRELNQLALGRFLDK